MLKAFEIYVSNVSIVNIIITILFISKNNLLRKL